MWFPLNLQHKSNEFILGCPLCQEATPYRPPPNGKRYVFYDYFLSKSTVNRLDMLLMHVIGFLYARSMPLELDVLGSPVCLYSVIVRKYRLYLYNNRAI